MKNTNLAVRVPAITAFFWAIKILATTVGETFADFLNVDVGLGFQVTTAIMTSLLVILLIIQFANRRYVPWVYWAAIVFISVVGTLLTDFLTDSLGVPLAVSSLGFALVLGVVFAIWYRRERTLEMKSINTASRETFYWLAILFTFALGTALGDYLAETIGLGYGLSALVYGGSIVLVYVLFKANKLNAVAAFWIAYVLTRPLGASVGDFLAQDKSNGGLGLGTTVVSWIFLLAILLLTGYLSFSKRDHITK